MNFSEQHESILMLMASVSGEGGKWNKMTPLFKKFSLIINGHAFG